MLRATVYCTQEQCEFYDKPRTADLPPVGAALSMKPEILCDACFSTVSVPVGEIRWL